MRVLLWILIGLLLLCAGAGVWVYMGIRDINTVPVTDDLWMLTGFGSNVAVLRTDAGTVLVDSMTFHMQGDLIREHAEALTGQSVVLLINTHYHFDHTHGNPAFDHELQIVSTHRTLRHLEVFDPELVNKPNDTFSDLRVMTVGGQRIRLMHPGRGHTDGDLVVLFEDQGVLHTGDLYFNRHYPNIDLEGGGSVIEWDATLDEVLALDFEHVIPGHGALSDRAGLMQFQQFVRQLAEVGGAAASLEEAVGSSALTTDAGYEPIAFAGIPLGLDRTFVLTRAWQEANGEFERRSLR